eukprot:c25590_g1_i1 orf=122-286(-)
MIHLEFLKSDFPNERYNTFSDWRKFCFFKNRELGRVCKAYNPSITYDLSLATIS